MPAITYYLNEAKTDVLTARWQQFYENFELTHNDHLLGVVPYLGHLPTGTRYELADGRVITAQVVRIQGESTLELGVDGELVPGSGTSPERAIKHALYVLLFAGLLNVTLGLAALYSGGFGVPAFVEGGVLVGLGWWGYRAKSAVAFYIGIGLLALSKLISFLQSLETSSSSTPFVGVAVQLFFCVILYHGAVAARELRAERRQELAETQAMF